MISMSIKAPKKPSDNSKKSVAGTEATNTSLDESAYRTIDELIEQVNTSIENKCLTILVNLICLP